MSCKIVHQDPGCFTVEHHICYYRFHSDPIQIVSQKLLYQYGYLMAALIFCNVDFDRFTLLSSYIVQRQKNTANIGIGTIKQVDKQIESCCGHRKDGTFDD